jgi:cellobiose phosphorylase
VTRRFRGATYRIQISNPDGVSKGLRSLTVDGERIEGPLVPAAAPGAEVIVEAILG